MKRALVLGSDMQGLRGVEVDTRCMAEMLRRRGFEVDRRLGDRATRAGMLEGYDALIAASREGDAAVVYYSGHGFYAGLLGPGPRSWQCIAPTDLEASTATDWRGITAWELSIKQAQLTAATKNVTIILDCCAASQMSRSTIAQHAAVRALPNPRLAGFDRHLAALHATYGKDADAAAAFVTGNPHAVRLVACGETEAAYEGLDPRSGRYQGAFTAALAEILEEVGDAALSWAAIADALRARVLRRFPMQRPEVEGPRHRELFSLVEQNGTEQVSVGACKGGYRLSAGRLTGVTLGDVYGVMGLGAARYDSGAALAQLEVTEVAALSATAKWRQGAKQLPVDAVAFPLLRNAERRAVVLDAPAALRGRLIEDLSATPTLRVAEKGELGAVATLRLAGDALTIEDAAGPLFPAARFPQELPGTLKNLANLGAAQGLRELLGEHGVFAGELAIEFGIVEGGELRPLAEHGSHLGLGDRIYLKVESRARRRLYIHVFNVGVRSTISSLSAFAPAGAFLDGGDAPLILGQVPRGSLEGLPLYWPALLPRSFARIDELVVIATTAKTSLLGLETREFFSNHRDPGGSKLSDLLAQLQDGLPRDVSGETPRDSYFAKRFSFTLHPVEAPLGGMPPVADRGESRSRCG